MKQFDSQPSARSKSRGSIVSALLLFCSLAISNLASATNFVPTIFTDPDYTAINNATGVITAGTGTGQISLRSALQAADNSVGPHTITLAGGTYTVSGGVNIGTYIIFGSSNNQTITINGVVGTPLTTIIDMATGIYQDRIFAINVATLGATTNVDVSVNYVKFTHGHLKTDSYGGGAIEFAAGDPACSLTLSHCDFSNNTIDATAGTTGGAVNYSGSGNLSVDNCTFTSNSNDNSDGGALYYFFNNNYATGNMTVTNSTFTNNTATSTGPGSGGAIGIAAQGRISPFNQVFTATIQHNTFTGNTAPGAQGGAILVDNGDAAYTVNINYNRFVNNSSSSAATGALGMSSASGSVSAINNWWGCNTSPAVAGACNRAGVVGSGGTGVLTTSPWLQLKATASPTPICPTAVFLGNTSTVTASFLTNSDGNAIAVANLDRVIGLPISFTAILGNLSAAQTAIQSNGTATVLFTSNGTPGNGSVNAVVDNVPNNDAVAKASIFINTPASISTPPTNATVCNLSTATFTVAAAGVPAPTFQWRKGTTNLINGATGTGSTIGGATTSTLTITNASSSDNASNYNVVVTNSCASVTSGDVSLTTVLPPVVNAPTVTQPTCAIPSGTIVVNATGSLTLEYSKDGTNWQLSNTFSSLAPGNYSISVRYQGISGCVTSYSGNPVVINPIPASPVVNAPTVTQPTCAVPSGTIVINATGTSTLEYSDDGTNWQLSNTFSGLAPGNYTISARLQNSTSCVTAYSSNPVVIAAIPTPPVVNAPTVTQPSCAITTGTIVVNATGAGTLEYSKDGTNWQLSNSFAGLAPGNYSISARLQSSTTCVTAYSGNPVVINAVPTAPSVSSVSVTQPTCAVPTGTIVVTASGSGTLEYSKDGTNWQPSNSFSGLAPGNYSISVRLQASPSCIGTYSGNPVVIDPVPSAPVVNAPSVTQPTCAVPTGTIVINATGSGTLEYSKDGTNWQLSNSFSGLAPGNYNISARLQSSPTCVTSYSSNPVVLNAATGCTVPPSITCPANITVTAAAGQCSQSVPFAATATGVPAPTIVYKIGATVITSPHTFPVGTTTVSATATNVAGSDNCSFTVTVQDNQPPVINTVTSPLVLLWSPNHKYQTITISQLVASVTDNCGSITLSNVVITKVTSDEADNAPGNGDGNTTDDIKIASNCKSVDLRSERMDGGNGRVYTVYFSVTDANGNTGTASNKVYVPLNQNGSTAIDNGPDHTIYSNCYNPNVVTQTRAVDQPEIKLNDLVTVQTHPNPFSSFTTILYQLPADAHVRLEIYNSLGQRIAMLVDAHMNAGQHAARFDALNRAPGVYLYHLTATDADGKAVEMNGKMVIER